LRRREDQNILKLEIDEIMDESGPGEIPDLFPNFLSETLNSFSSRFAFFTISAKREGFIDPFLRFLDFFGKNVKIS
jgi:hypothetical protein